ncbi:MAG: PH domain-containing protein [Lachnospiraceae bacterium]|nr:PH domain-containing protein [Lachnospiraceae bacterium]
MGVEIIDGEECVIEKKRWALFGLPFTFTKYIVKKDVLTIESGFFTKTENDCYMYKIQDVELTRNFFQRLFGLGCVICFTGDTTHPKLYLHNIKNSKETKDYILKYSEEARLKRRTLNTLNIGAQDIDDAMDDC